MDTQPEQVMQNAENLKDIPKWTRRYAQNRTLTFLVIILMSIFIGMAVAAPIFVIFLGVFKRNVTLTATGIALFVPVLYFYIMFFKKFAGKNKGLLDQIIDRKIYAKEGTASMPCPQLSKKRKIVDIIAGIGFMVLLIGTMEFAMLGYIPTKYILPVMALFVVPFGVYQYYTLKPRLGPLLLLFPVLYTIHAILIIAGLPIYFTGTFAVSLNMILPTLYMFLSCTIGHLYSRYALKKLKTAVNLQEKNNG